MYWCYTCTATSRVWCFMDVSDVSKRVALPPWHRREGTNFPAREQQSVHLHYMRVSTQYLPRHIVHLLQKTKHHPFLYIGQFKRQALIIGNYNTHRTDRLFGAIDCGGQFIYLFYLLEISLPFHASLILRWWRGRHPPVQGKRAGRQPGREGKRQTRR